MRPQGASPNAVLHLLAILALLLMPGSANASSATALKNYEAGKYDAALKEYDQLRAKRPEDSRLAYNAGAAAYQAKQFEEAARHFSSATGARDPALAQSAFYNLGNAYFQVGDAATEAAQKQEAWQSAIGFYDTALKLRPEDADAKHNRDYVQRKLEELKKQQEPSKDKQEKNEEDKKGDQKDEQKKEDKSGQDKKPDDQKKDEQKPQKPEDSKPDQQKKDQPNQPPDQKKPEEQKQPEQKKPEDKPGEQKQGQKGEQGEKDSAQAAALGQMTLQQAMQLLDSQRSEERALIFLPATNATQKANNRVFKNW